MYSYVHTNVGWLCEKVCLWTCIPIRYTWNHVQKLFGFQYMSLYIVDGGVLSDYAYLYLYWEGFNKLDNHIWPLKVLEILYMTLHRVTILVQMLRFRGLGDVWYGFYCEKWGSELCNFTSHHSQSIHFRCLHIVAFVWV